MSGQSEPPQAAPSGKDPTAPPGGKAEEAGELKMLDAPALRFTKKRGRLRLTIGNERSYVRVSLLRVFPLSDPEHCWSVRDGGGKEIGVIEEPARLDPESRKLAEAELARRYFLPVIRRVVKISERFGTVDWEVETDLGPCRFTTRELRNNVLRLPAGRYILKDVEENRFDVPDLNRLDSASQGHLLKYL